MPFVQARVYYDLEVITLTEAGICRICGAQHQPGARVHGFRVELPDDRWGCLPYCPGCALLGTSYEDMMDREFATQHPPITIAGFDTP